MIPASEGLAGFEVEVTDRQQKNSKSVVYTNNGHGFPFSDAILPQFELSCIDGSTNGLLNLTIAVSRLVLDCPKLGQVILTIGPKVLDSAKITQLSGSVEVPTKEDTDVPADRTTYVPRLERKPLVFKKGGTIKDSGYTLYHAQHTWDRAFFRKHYDIQGSNRHRTFSSLFNDADLLQQCS